MIRTAILAISDRGNGDEGLAATLNELRRLLQTGAFVEVEFLIVPDEQAVIRSKLRILSDGDATDLILTLGSASLGPKERAPEATKEVLEREISGLAELMRAAWSRRSAEAALFRGVCGLRRRTLIVNLPGEAAAVGLTLEAILPSLPLAVAALSSVPRVS